MTLPALGPFGRTVVCWAGVVRQSLDVSVIRQFPDGLLDKIAVHVAMAVVHDLTWDDDQPKPLLLTGPK